MGLLFFLLGLGVLMPARAADPLPPGTKIFFDSENREDAKAGTIVTEWFILPKTLDKLPAYDPALADPPLSLLKAMGIAREQVNHEVAAPEKWRLDSIELHEIDLGQSGLTIPSGWTPKRTGKWYYKIIFEKPVDAEDIAAKNYSTPCPVYVLMDGSVAEHRERPQTEDEKNSDKDMVTSLKNAFKGDPKKEAKP